MGNVFGLHHPFMSVSHYSWDPLRVRQMDGMSVLAGNAYLPFDMCLQLRGASSETDASVHVGIHTLPQRVVVLAPPDDGEYVCFVHKLRAEVRLVIPLVLRRRQTVARPVTSTGRGGCSHAACHLPRGLDDTARHAGVVLQWDGIFLEQRADKEFRRTAGENS